MASDARMPDLLYLPLVPMFTIFPSLILSGSHLGIECKCNKGEGVIMLLCPFLPNTPWLRMILSLLLRIIYGLPGIY